MLRQHRTAGAEIISDEPALPWLAGRTSPGSMVDLSYVRIQAGDLTTDDVVAAANEPGVCAVLLWSGRLAQLPGLRAALGDYRVGARSTTATSCCSATGCRDRRPDGTPEARLLRKGYDRLGSASR